MLSVKKTVAIIGLSVAAIGVSSAANAQDAGFYVGGSIGRSDTNNDVGSLAALGVVVTGNDERDTGWKVFGGYQITKNWGVELSYVDFGNFGITGRLGATPVTADAKVSGIALAAVGTLPLNDSFSLFAKLGGVYGTVKSSAVAGTAFVSDKDRTTDWTAGIGVKFNVNKNFAIRAEAERYEFSSNGNANLYTIGAQFKF
jgi:OOP family OmpA-OmpF porin